MGQSYSQREVERNEAVRLMERSAVTGADPSLAQIAAVTEGLDPLARVRLDGTVLRVRWYEPLGALFEEKS